MTNTDKCIPVHHYKEGVYHRCRFHWGLDKHHSGLILGTDKLQMKDDSKANTEMCMIYRLTQQNKGTLSVAN